MALPALIEWPRRPARLRSGASIPTTLEEVPGGSSRERARRDAGAPGESDDERCGSSRALEVAGAAVAYPREPRPRRPDAPACTMAGRRSLRRRAILRLRPRDQRATG